MGFPNYTRYVEAVEAGQTSMGIFRKTVSSAATSANDFIDYTYFSGNPPANFYASAPLEAAEIESIRGLPVPKVDNLFMKSIGVMSAASSGTGTTNRNQRLKLCDYLLYYPFIDTDAIGEEQVMTNTVTLPRYATGDGVQMIAVSQSAASTVGTFTVNYTNSDGVAGRVSQATFTKAVNGGGVVVSSQTNAVAGSQLFIDLQAGDRGVRSVQSVTFSAAGGGLMALVLVKPLFDFYTTEEARRDTNASFGAATYFDAMIQHEAVKIENGAVLGIFGLGNSGSLASSTLVGKIQTVWSN